MNSVSVQDVLSILESVVCLPDNGIDNNSVLGEDIAIDSTDMIRIISRLESKYQFKLTTQEILALNTVGDVVQIINRNRHRR